MDGIISHIFQDKHLFLLVLEQQFIKNINGKYQANKHQIYYFFNDMINIKEFDSSLLKIDKKNHTKILVFITLVTSHWKKLVIIKILIV